MNKLKGSLVYLLGPIENVADYGKGWRNEVTPTLQNMGIGVLDPCALKEDEPIRVTAKDLKEKGFEADLVGNKELSKECGDKIHEYVKDIVAWDLNAVDLSTFVLGYIDTDIHMAGSYCELTFACLQRKPAIIVCKQGRWNLPGWWFGMCEFDLVCNTFEEALKIISDVNDGKKIGKRWNFIDYTKVYKEL